MREEIRQDKDWVIRLRSLPEAPETYYLMELMASADFQTALQNYLDLDDLRAKLATWQSSFDAFEDMIGSAARTTRRCCPRSMRSSGARFADAPAPEQRKHLGERLQRMLIAPRRIISRRPTNESPPSASRRSTKRSRRDQSERPHCGARCLPPRCADVAAVDEYHER